MKIDLVYLWVDDTDWVWRSKFCKYLNDDMSNMNEYDSDAVGTCRFYNNDELKYSLRSAERYAPWINQIFIITDNQTPDWLNPENPKIRIINHQEIIPQEKLPLFNSCAIESRIPFIKDLSEFFLYTNDDMFFWNPVEKEFFFQGDKPVCRFADKFSKDKNCKHLYGKTIQRAYNIINKKFELNVPLCFPHHNIDAYRKSLFLECIKEFNDEFEQTLNHRFREDTDMQRTAVSYYMIAKGGGIFKSIKTNWINKYILKKPVDSRHYGIRQSIVPKIRRCNTNLICLNDCQRTTDTDRKIIKEFLEEKFPDKSSFEK